MKKLLQIFVSSIEAGILISLGGFVFLSYKETNLFLASFLFSLGLVTIIAFKLYLFTGKVGYIFDNKPRYLLDLLICWLGNLCGAIVTGEILKLTRVDLQSVVTKMVNIKLNDTIGSIFILSIFCGMMIYIAVETQKKEVPGVIKLFAIVIPVMVFIISGFEHCVANMFYFTYAGAWSWKSIGYLLIMTLGNGAGSLILWSLNHFIGLKDKKEENNSF